METNNKDQEALTNLLAQNANAIVSEGGAGAKSITKVVKHDQEVVGYELSDGSRVSMEQAIQMASANELEHVGVSTSKKGQPYIRSLADGDETNNLSNLPIIVE
ncbi:MAG: DUF3892 domain-containing protein [Cellulosilyticaceae bacterium]